MNLKEYIEKIWKIRYFWKHLASCDLKFRFRRSKLGMLWMLMQPLLLTCLMSIVFSVVFNQPLKEYALYILSGLVVWDLLVSSVIAGGSCIMASEAYIRQFKHPISIYSLRAALVYTTIFLVELIALLIWVVFTKPENLILGIFTIPLTTILYFMLSWAIVTIAGYSNTKYRDYPQVMGLIMQAIWYLSPVFFRKEMFMANDFLMAMFAYNPLTHLLNLVREPFVYGRMPSLTSYFYVILLISFFGVWAFFVNKKNEKQIIFYL